MKKGQLLSQPFVWIFALILGALILVWGIKTVMDLKGTADLVDLGKFVKDFEAKAQSFYNFGAGSTQHIPVSLSGDVKHICFTNPGKTREEYESSCKRKQKTCPEEGSCLTDCPSSPLTAINKGDEEFRLKLPNSEKNLWFLPLGSAKVDSFKIKYIELTEADIICYPPSSEIKMVSTGTSVELS